MAFGELFDVLNDHVGTEAGTAVRRLVEQDRTDISLNPTNPCNVDFFASGAFRIWDLDGRNDGPLIGTVFGIVHLHVIRRSRRIEGRRPIIGAGKLDVGPMDPAHINVVRKRADGNMFLVMDAGAGGAGHKLGRRCIGFAAVRGLEDKHRAVAGRPKLPLCLRGNELEIQASVVDVSIAVECH